MCWGGQLGGERCVGVAKVGWGSANNAALSVPHPSPFFFSAVLTELARLRRRLARYPRGSVMSRPRQLDVVANVEALCLHEEKCDH